MFRDAHIGVCDPAPYVEAMYFHEGDNFGVRVRATRIEVLKVELTYWDEETLGASDAPCLTSLDQFPRDAEGEFASEHDLFLRVTVKVGNDELTTSTRVTDVMDEMTDDPATSPWVATRPEYTLGAEFVRQIKAQRAAMEAERIAKHKKGLESTVELRKKMARESPWAEWLDRTTPIGDDIPLPEGWVSNEQRTIPELRGRARHADLKSWVAYGNIDNPPWLRK